MATSDFGASRPRVCSRTSKYDSSMYLSHLNTVKWFFECICTFLLNSMLWQWVPQYNWDLYEKRYFLSFSRDLLPDNLNLMPLSCSIMKKKWKTIPYSSYLHLSWFYRFVIFLPQSSIFQAEESFCLIFLCLKRISFLWSSLQPSSVFFFFINSTYPFWYGVQTPRSVQDGGPHNEWNDDVFLFCS